MNPQEEELTEQVEDYKALIDKQRQALEAISDDWKATKVVLKEQAEKLVATNKFRELAIAILDEKEANIQQIVDLKTELEHSKQHGLSWCNEVLHLRDALALAQNTQPLPAEDPKTEAPKQCSNPTCIKDLSKSNIILKRCTICYTESYCTKKCQTQHWKSAHKKSL